jgi:hypothetical protein
MRNTAHRTTKATKIVEMMFHTFFPELIKVSLLFLLFLLHMPICGTAQQYRDDHGNQKTQIFFMPFDCRLSPEGDRSDLCCN